MATQLSCYYQNVRGLRGRVAEFRREILKRDYDIYILTETWLNESIFDTELFDDRYTVYRRDRHTSALQNHKRFGGGVLVAVSNRLISCREHEFEDQCEDVWISIDMTSGRLRRKCYVCAVYLPPPVARDDLTTFLDSSSRVLEGVCESDIVLIVGDFNISGILWEEADNGSSYVTPKCTSSSAIKNDMIDFLYLSSLHQFNGFTNDANNVLDLVLCNREVIKCEVCRDPCRSIDAFHPALCITIADRFCKRSKNVSNYSFNFYKADYELVSECLSRVDWGEVLGQFGNVNDMVERFYSILDSIIRTNVPLKRTTGAKYPVWYTPELIRLLKRKRKYHVRSQRFNNPLDRLEFQYLRKDCDKLISRCYNDYIDRIERDINKNPKCFWTHVKNLRKSSSMYPTNMKLETRPVGKDERVCDLFAEYFSSTYKISNQLTHNTELTNELSKKVSGPPSCSGSSVLLGVALDREEIIKNLRGLDLAKSRGPDNIPPMFFRRCAKSLAVPLQTIFNCSLASGVFPDKWKLARVVPVLKKGRRDLVSNYRPVSILSVLAKVFESLVHFHLYRCVSGHIAGAQHGFMAKRSTKTNLLAYVSDLIGKVDEGFEVDAIYTDFSKAFDTVDHSLLVKKLQCFGIQNPLLNWCNSYLRSRRSAVVIDGSESIPFSPSSGVPQGSILGPLFFNIFINDIVESFKNSNIYMFADDLKFTRVIRSYEDAHLLQQDLGRLEDWCRVNAMELNIDKCSHIKFSRKRYQAETSYHLNGRVLDRVLQVRDLGIVMDSELRFIPHIDSIICSAGKSLGFLLRNGREFKKSATLIHLFNTLVRSKLEYCSAVWSPVYRTHIDRIERVQKRFLRSAHFRLAFRDLGRLQYSEKLRQLEMHSLERRRRALDLTTLYSIVHGLMDCADLLAQVNFNVPRRMPRHPAPLFAPYVSRTNLGKQAPLCRMTSTYCADSDCPDILALSLSKFRWEVLGRAS